MNDPQPSANPIATTDLTPASARGSRPTEPPSVTTDESSAPRPASEPTDAPAGEVTTDSVPAKLDSTVDYPAPGLAPDPLATTDAVTPEKPREKSARPSVPGYEILGELGRGGMGVVYKARHLALNRIVALKMVLAGAHADAGQLARFNSEAQAVARFQHPNIVQIYEVGSVEGLPYFSLEFVDGGSLSGKIARTPQTPRFAAELVEALARAMSYAHDRGVIHRDLKPANVLLTAEGTPKITDFGLAKRLEGDSFQTRSGAIVGTPSYMAPEQARGDLKEVGPLSDTYSLGAILYDLLTGRPPFLGASILDTLDQVRTQEPVPPADLIGHLPKDLETICLKCLQKEPAKRYASAAAMADDLRRYLNGEPILARPVSAPERAWRWAKRNPRVSGLGAAVAALLVVIAITSSVFAWQFNLKKQAAEIAAEKEKKEHDRAEDALKKEKVAHDLATEEANIAREQSFGAYGALTIMLVNAQNRLRGEPQGQKLREDLVRMAMVELDKIRATTKHGELIDRRDATAHSLLGDGYLEGDRLKDAAEEYDQAASIFEQLLKDNPNDHANKRNLAAVISKRGDAALRLRETRKARDYYQQALDLRMEWARMTPDRIPPIVAIANSYGLLGRVSLLLGDPKAALTNYLASKEYYDKLPEEALDVGLIRREMAALEEALGDLYVRTGDEEKSRKHYAESLRRREEMLKQAPDNRDVIRDYALSQISEGHRSLQNANDPVGAYAHYDVALQHLQRIAKDDPNSVVARQDGAGVRYFLGATALRIASESPGLLGVGWLATSRFHFDRCLKVREDLAKIIPREQVGLMLAQARCGKHVEAAAFAQKFAASNDPNLLFQTACGYALSADAVRMTGSTVAADQALAQKYLDGAYAALQKAVKNGWKDPATLRTEPDLDPIRSDRRYAALMNDVRTAADGH